MRFKLTTTRFGSKPPITQSVNVSAASYGEALSASMQIIDGLYPGWWREGNVLTAGLEIMDPTSIQVPIAAWREKLIKEDAAVTAIPVAAIEGVYHE